MRWIDRLMLAFGVGMIVLIVLSGCAQEPPAQPMTTGWAARTKRPDPSPAECQEMSRRAEKPTLADRDYSDDESAAAYKALSTYTDAELDRADRCRIWANGQRK